MSGSEQGGPDRWGRDPAVQSLRQVFARLEQVQREILSRHRIPEFEPRLRPARGQARRLLERGWALAARQGLEVSPEELGKLYDQILAAVLARQGLIPPPDEVTGPRGALLRTILNQE